MQRVGHDRFGLAFDRQVRERLPEERVAGAVLNNLVGWAYTTGRIRILRQVNGTWRIGQTFLDIRSKVKDTDDEQGLLGLAFPPDYAASGLFFACPRAQLLRLHNYGRDNPCPHMPHLPWLQSSY